MGIFNRSESDKIMKKRCSKCYKIKERTEYYRNKKSKDGLEYYCKKCSSRRYYNKLKNENGLYGDKKLDRHFLYGDGDVMRKKKYLSDRSNFFKENGHGWWWDLNRDTPNRYPSGKAKPVKARKRLAGRFEK